MLFKFRQPFKASMSDQTSVTDLLKERGIRKTPARIGIATFFLDQKHAVSHADLESELGDGYDRVTIYRTLHTFTEKGLIHEINDGSGVGKYALCNHECGEHRHLDDHIHFSCKQCGKTYCLDGQSLPPLNLPAGYHVEAISFVASGVCKDCSMNPN